MQDLPRITPYCTVKEPSEIVWVEKRSRFIGRCYPVTTEAEALAHLETLRKQHWDATHNCYAYALRNGTARFSDDGEPSGTAGMPMMDALKKIGVVDVLVVATRYFGGILLGAGGLVRAYSKTACDAIRAATVVQMLPCTKFSLHVAYPYWNSVRLIVERFGRIETLDYTDAVDCTVWVQETEADRFLAALTDRTEARVGATPLEKEWFPFERTEE